MPANEKTVRGDDPREQDAREQVGRMLHWLSRKHFQYCENKLQAVGIGPGQVPILMELGKHGQLSQRELSEKVRVTPATISGTLKRLERGGVIQRVGDDCDARVSLVSLTELGRKRLCETRKIFREADCWLVSKFSQSECEELLVYLKQMLEVVQEGLWDEAHKEGENA